MDKNYKVKRHIKTELTLYILAVTMTVVLVASFAMYIVTSKSIRENVRTNTETSVEQINYDLDSYIKNVETIITGLEYSFLVDSFFAAGENDELGVSSFLNSLIENRDDVINIFLIRSDGTIISNQKNSEYKDVDFRAENYYTSATINDGLYISTSHVQDIFLGQHSWVVSCSKAVYNEKGDLKGVIVVDLNFEHINDLTKRVSLLERGYIFIISSDGSYVYHPKLNLIYSGMFDENIARIIDESEDSISYREDDENVEYIAVHSDFTSWTTIGKIYENDYNIYLKRLNKFLLIFSLIAMLVTGVLVFVISWRSLRPINSLVDGMLSFTNGNLDVKVEPVKDNELGLLTEIFNGMTEKIKNLIETNKNVERNKRKSDFKLLQSQINPHFLYNTLDSIVWMGETGRNEEVVMMTSSLAKMFRMGLNKGQEYVTIREEIEHISSYLLIQKMRYGEKLTYDISPDESILDRKIIKILLQPIVENAIYHGIKNIPNDGEISIRIYVDDFAKILLSEDKKDGKSIYFEVEDNGPGISEENIVKIFDGELKTGTKGSGIGVNNVNDRIKMYYGEAYGLHIASEVYEGTTVTIKIPFEEADYEES